MRQRTIGLLLMALGLILIGLAVFVYLTPPVRASYCGPQSPSPIPSVIPSPSPSIEPTSTPEPSESPRPSQSPEPTATPKPPESTNQPAPSDPPKSESKAPTCDKSKPGDVAGIFVDQGIPNDHKVEVRWWPPSGADKVHIRFAEYTQEGWPYSLLDTPNDGHEVIDMLKIKTNYRFQVAGVNGCTVGNWSVLFDPQS